MIRYLIGCLLLFIGIIVGLGLHHYYPSFPLEEKINIVELATLSVTIFLAVYIPIFLERNMQNRRGEKNVIIRKIEALQSTLCTVNQTVSECIQKGTVSIANTHIIINKFTTISNELETIITLISLCHKNKFKKEFEDIKELRYQYRKIVTGGDFQKKGFKYSMLDKKEEEKIFHKFDKELCLLVFKVNKI